MTLKELFEKFPVEKFGDYNITVAKHDKNQLTAFTTVPVDSARRGFDWTHEQIVLEPSVRLNTHPEEIEANLKKNYEEKTRMRTDNLRIVAKLIKYVEEELEDGPKKDRIKEMIREIK